MIEMTSNIQSFFKRKNVFITGGTGFLGKVLIETLLRTTEIRKIFILMRSKRSKNEEERFNEIFQDPLFGKLHIERPQFRDYLHMITGDCSEPNLGISEDDRQQLIENVNIIVHLAATVRFNEAMSTATKINVRAILDLMNLAKEMKHLKSFVHVSTAYVNCTTAHSDERFFTDKLSVNSHQLLTLLDTLDNGLLDHIGQQLLAEYPNTYTFTKAVGEEVVQKHCGILPICIVRPGGVVQVADDSQLTGWLNTMQGGISAIYCAGIGLLRVVNGKGENSVPMIPVDYCVNEIMAAAWYIGSKYTNSSADGPMIFNAVPDENNTIAWGKYWKTVKKYICKSPYTTMKWYPFFIIEPNRILYRIFNFVYGTLPAYLVDGCLTLMRKPTQMVKIHKKTYNLAEIIRHFVINNFTFGISNTRKLWHAMSVSDQSLYNFNMRTFDWEPYIQKQVLGLRHFIAKDSPESIPQAKQRLKRFYVYNLIVHGFMISLILLIIWKTVAMFF
ncbi:fatty acyl-CoA reductase wat-like [Haematobia irritans]|uniref:fatty acyl-CoA reductase wat-like n=1 Tax=Haematobia irritans TaxID=7368 RepID=UPI003F5032D7